MIDYEQINRFFFHEIGPKVMSVWYNNNNNNNIIIIRLVMRTYDMTLRLLKSPFLCLFCVVFIWQFLVLSSASRKDAILKSSTLLSFCLILWTVTSSSTENITTLRKSSVRSQSIKASSYVFIAYSIITYMYHYHYQYTLTY